MEAQTEVERLRARVRELEAQQQTAQHPAESAPGHPSRGRRSAWWGAGSAVLIVVACLLAPLSVASVWASNELLDTEQYVETVAPLVDDPAVQEALATEVAARVFESLDVEGVATEALETIASQDEVPVRVAAVLPTLAVPLASGVESFTRDQVDAFFASPEFAQLWAEVNRVAHEQVVTLLEGNQGGAVSAQGDTITLNIAPIIAAVKDRLLAQGFALAENVPEVEQSFVLAESDAITQAQGFYRLLSTLGVWLPIVVLAIFVLGVVMARDRRRALLRGGLGVAAAMIALGVVLTAARIWYVETTPADILTPEAAGGVFDTLIRFLRSSLRALGVAGLVIALIAFLAGPSTAAVRTRATFRQGIGSARGGAESAGWDTGGFGGWTFAHRRLLQVLTFAGAGLVLMFWAQPSARVVVWTAVAVILALALIEFLGTPPVAATAAAPQPVVGPAAGAAGPVVPQQPGPPDSSVPGGQASAPSETRLQGADQGSGRQR